MNEEALKETLLDIMDEARNLDASELEVIPGTNILVKKGRVDEFKASEVWQLRLFENVILPRCYLGFLLSSFIHFYVVHHNAPVI